ncbi:MAG TPA: type II secretion system protein [Pyrinomonadaceae bacterium]|nr:type II secretion system protein [Pyrinomonadaceae bacterium]
MNKNHRGFSLIEALLAIVVFGFVAYALVAFMSSRVKLAERLETSKAASDTLENALNKLSAIPYKDLAVGSGFTKVDDATILLQPCTTQTCDYVLDPPSGAATSSIAGGYSWQSGVVQPAETRFFFVRRWRIEDVSAELKLRRITVAVLTDEQSTEPLAMIETIVGER